MTNHVKAITISNDEKELFLGLYSSEIYQLTADNNQPVTSKLAPENLMVKQLMSGHFARNLKWTNEVWGLSQMKNDTFLTVADDGTLRMWSSSEHKLLKVLKLDINDKGITLQPEKTTGDLQSSAKLRYVTACQEDVHAAVGCLDGTIRIVDIEKWKQI